MIQSRTQMMTRAWTTKAPISSSSRISSSSSSSRNNRRRFVGRYGTASMTTPMFGNGRLFDSRKPKKWSSLNAASMNDERRWTNNDSTTSDTNSIQTEDGFKKFWLLVWLRKQVKNAADAAPLLKWPTSALCSARTVRDVCKNALVILVGLFTFTFVLGGIDSFVEFVTKTLIK